MLPTKFRFIWLRFFRNRPIRNKNCMWWPCLLTDRDKMSNLHRGHSIDDSYQVSVVAMFQFSNLHRTFHRCFLPSLFGQAVSEEKILKNWPIRNKNCLWWPSLVTDHNKMCTLKREPSIDASYQVSVHLAEGFQRRRLKCEK